VLVGLVTRSDLSVLIVVHYRQVDGQEKMVFDVLARGARTMISA
jgi:hypothetical protein